jgi:glycerophosphoryl diester phosphodiesterase
MPRTSSRPLLLGHRGARAIRTIPENTLASFDRALADGCDGFEFDVRLTLDQQPVICHDSKLQKVEISRTELSRIGSLPRISEVLARYDAFLDIELKVPGIEQILLEELRKHTPRAFVVSSFLPGVLRTVYEMDQTIPLGLICESRSQLQLWTGVPIQYVIPHRKLIRKQLISTLHTSGKRVLAWTVNDAEEMERLAEWEIDGIVSDETKLLARTLG